MSYKRHWNSTIRIIIVINKIDRADARIDEVVDEVLELLMDLNASDEQLDSPILYCSGRAGAASDKPDDVEGKNLEVLFRTILQHIPAPEGDEAGPLQMLVSSIDYNDYVGRIAVGRIERGSIHANSEVMVCDYHEKHKPYRSKIVNLYQIDGLKRVPAESATVGDIVCLSGITDITIGDTVTAVDSTGSAELCKDRRAHRRDDLLPSTTARLPARRANM